MHQLNLFEAAFSIHQPCPVRSRLAADWFCLEIEGQPMSVIPHQGNRRSSSMHISGELFRLTFTTAYLQGYTFSFALSVMQLVKMHSARRASSPRRERLGLRPNYEPQELRARGARGVAVFVSPPGEARRSRLRSFGFPRHQSRGHLIFCTGVPDKANIWNAELSAAADNGIDYKALRSASGIRRPLRLLWKET